MARKLLTDRNLQIAAALDGGEAPKAVAGRFGISYSNMYRAARQGRAIAVTNRFHAPAEQFTEQQYQPVPARDVGAGLFSEMTVTGLRRFGGRVDEESERAMNTLAKRLKIYREMGDDPIIAAVLQAIKMTLRRVSWSVAIEGTTDADKQLAEWLETAMDDMSIAWTDVIDQALGMIQYGFYPAELVYKKRAGDSPAVAWPNSQIIQSGGAEQAASGQKPASSKYNDGLIGWRKWTFIAPESLAPSESWIFDEHGGLAGLWQQTLPEYKLVALPIQKMILFRTTAEKNNPEGRSLLRAMYQPWYLWRNLQEVEAISAERMGAGFPVMYLGKDVGKSADGSSGDMATYREIVRDIRIDEQMGLVIPNAKMGAGAREGEGVLFEFATPPSRGAVDFNQVITRYETRGTMVGLAQFVHLGMNQVGARALGESSLDFFTLAVSAWADGIADMINRFAVEKLIKLNGFTGMTAIPKITHEPVMKVGLADIANYVNSLAGAQLLTASPELENFLRKYADLPEKPVDMGGAPVVEGGNDEGGTMNEEGAQGMGVEGFYSPDQPRDESGRWGEGGSGSGGNDGEGKSDVPQGFNLRKERDQKFSKSELKDLPKRYDRGNLNSAMTSATQVSLRDGKPVYITSGNQGFTVGLDSSALKMSQDFYRVMAREEGDNIVVNIRQYKMDLGDKPANHSADSFADLRGTGKRGAKTREINAVNAYQKKLEAIYAAWADDAAAKLATVEDDDFPATLTNLLGQLQAQLTAAGRESLPGAVSLALGDTPPPPAAMRALVDAMEANEAFLQDSLIPAAQRKLELALRDEDIVAALGAGAGAQALHGVMDTLASRVSQYSNQFWSLYNQTVGMTGDELGQKVFWKLDDLVQKHCEDCLAWGDKEYESYEAMLIETGGLYPGSSDLADRGGCRCVLEMVE